MTTLIDEWGNREFVKERGRMSKTKHTTVLSVLEKRALRYRRRGHNKVDKDEALISQAIDETGTVDTSPLTDSDSDSITSFTCETEQHLLELKGVSKELLSVHGWHRERRQRGSQDSLWRIVMELIQQ